MRLENLTWSSSEALWQPNKHCFSFLITDKCLTAHGCSAPDWPVCDAPWAGAESDQIHMRAFICTHLKKKKSKMGYLILRDTKPQVCLVFCCVVLCFKAWPHLFFNHLSLFHCGLTSVALFRFVLSWCDYWYTTLPVCLDINYDKCYYFHETGNWIALCVYNIKKIWVLSSRKHIF